MKAQRRIVTDGYSVVFLRGTRTFALMERGVAGRAFFLKRRDAVAFKKDLAEHQLRVRVVKARAILEETR